LLLSMTGFGEAHHQQNGLAIALEVRTINSRYFKLVVRASEIYSSLETDIEDVVRQQIKRGTVQVSLRVEKPKTADDYRLNTQALSSYRDQLEALHAEWHINEPVTLERLLALPGVVAESQAVRDDVSADWPLIRQTLEEALTRLSTMRVEEGRAMAADLRLNCQTIAQELENVAVRAPLVVDSYRSRLQERLQKALAEYQVTLDPADVIRELSLFAERSDISEEIVRLRSHLEQFDGFLDATESSGRKLEFLTQEMFRETNTIGSKANDLQIARHVIEMKAAIERIREMIQNIE
jgi:uncharacterized protein (TIGR00255 family)